MIPQGEPNPRPPYQPRPAVFADPGPAADKHTSTVEGAAAYDRQRSARDGDDS